MSVMQDELFRSWLEDMGPRLARFEDFLMPDGWVAGFTRDSLASLEQLMLGRWPDRRSFEDEKDVDFTDGAVRYIGESYLRLGGGGWFVDNDPSFVFSGRPCIRLDTLDRTPISPRNLMGALLTRRTGEVLVRVWDGQVKNLEKRRLVEGPGWVPRRDASSGTPDEPQPESPELDAWTAGMPARIEVLRERASRSEGRQLDGSASSLPVLAEVLREDVLAGALSEGEPSLLRDAYASYLAEVARGAAGGAWVFLPGDPQSRNPFVGRPFIERHDADGAPRRLFPHACIDKCARTSDVTLLLSTFEAYAGA